MSVSIRPARVEDKQVIAGFASDTFEWGDYVVDAFDRWLQEEQSVVFVAVDSDDRPVAVSRGTLLSPREAWYQGARVRPDLRRRGIAGELASQLLDWSRERGAQVGRLLIEDWNDPAKRQVEKSGFRATGAWATCSRPVNSTEPVSSGNGGKRVSAADRLEEASSSEAESAYLSWAPGPLSRAGRGLFAKRWTLRRLKIDDLSSAARRQSLWVARTGWALGEVDGETFDVGWMETGEGDAYDLSRALIDKADEVGAAFVRITIPAVDWLVAAALRAGCESHPMTVYEVSL